MSSIFKEGPGTDTYFTCYGLVPIFWLTYWGRVTHICVIEISIIGSDNGLSPERRQAIIWTNAGILLIGPLGTNFSETLIEIQTFSLKKMRLKMSSAKWGPFCFGLNVLITTSVANATILPWILLTHSNHGPTWFLHRLRFWSFAFGSGHCSLNCVQICSIMGTVIATFCPIMYPGPTHCAWLHMCSCCMLTIVLGQKNIYGSDVTSLSIIHIMLFSCPITTIIARAPYGVPISIYPFLFALVTITSD